MGASGCTGNGQCRRCGSNGSPEGELDCPSPRPEDCVDPPPVVAPEVVADCTKALPRTGPDTAAPAAPAPEVCPETEAEAKTLAAPPLPLGLGGLERAMGRAASPVSKASMPTKASKAAQRGAPVEEDLASGLSLQTDLLPGASVLQAQAKGQVKSFVKEMVRGREVRVLAPTGDVKTCTLSINRGLDTLKLQMGSASRKIVLKELDEIHAGAEDATAINTPLDELCATLYLSSGDAISFRMADIDERDTFIMCRSPTMMVTGGASDEDSEAWGGTKSSRDVTPRGYTSLPLGCSLLIGPGQGLEAASSRRQRQCLPTRRFVGGTLLVSAGCLAIAWRLVPHSAQGPNIRDDTVIGLVGAPCAGRGENCSGSKCCKEPGMSCYTKSKDWAMCRPFCISGPDPTDQVPSPWACQELGARTPGDVPMDFWGGLKPATWVQEKCSAVGENCYKTGCCKDPGMTCFAKNEAWASCKPGCKAGPDLTDISPDPWMCIALGNPTPGAPPATYTNSQKAAPWVAEKCAGAGANCVTSRCCSQAGTTCFRKNAEWAGCRASCESGPNLHNPDNGQWDCEALGPRTPGIPTAEGPVAAWVATKCTGPEGDCSATKCCSTPGTQCFEKNAGWATCMHGCAPGIHANDPDKTPWTCRRLGPRNPGKMVHPSLYCWALSRSSGEEANLMKYQKTSGLSIFQCEEWSVFSDWAFDLGGDLATPIGDLTAQKGQWGSWLNTLVFVKAWHSIFEQGQFREHDWTVKVDPDAVFLPDRLKSHLAPLVPDEPWCIHNSLKDTPMLGPIEILSRGAMYVYLDNNDPLKSGTDKAVCENPYMGASGEDGYMSGCLKVLQVKGNYDGLILKKDGKFCGDGKFVTYHPLKTVAQYKVCQGQTIG